MGWTTDVHFSVRARKGTFLFFSVFRPLWDPSILLSDRNWV
jgi:hypothetical protein